MILRSILIYFIGRYYQKHSNCESLSVAHFFQIIILPYRPPYHIHIIPYTLWPNHLIIIKFPFIFYHNFTQQFDTTSIGIIISSMQINLDLYIRNFRIFYQQLTKGHSKQQHLNKQFKGLIENELRKWKKGHGFSKISETSSDNPLLNRVRENRKNKEQVKLNIQPYYASQKVENCVVFGYTYLVLEQKNIAAFQFLQDSLKDHFVDKQTYSTPVLRKMNYIWNKFEDIISGRRKVVRFQKQLQEYFKELPQVFLDLLYKVIIQDKVLVVENKPMYFQELSQFLTLKIEYFEVNEQQNMKTMVYGQNQKYSLKIGYLKAQNQFVNVGKLPEKQEKQIGKQITFDKFDEIAKNLNEMYTMNMKEYLGLSNLKYKAENMSNISNMTETRQLTTSRKKDESIQDTPSQFISI